MEEKKKITIGYEAKRIFHNSTGLGNYSRDLIRILNQFYPENHYLLYNPKIKKKINFSIENSNVEEKTPIGFINTFFKNFWRQNAIISDLQRDKIDIFHGLSGELPFKLSQNNIKSVVTIHDLIFLKFPQFYSWFDRKIHFYKFKKAAIQANHIIAISEQTKKDIIDYFKVDPNKISVLYQGCSDAFKKEYPTELKEKVATKHNLPKEFILNVGTIEERKNIFEVVKAIKNTEIPLIIIGKKTKYSDTIEAYLKEHNMENQVRFLSGISLEELAVIYQLATIFVYPSLYEGFGIPIIEALFSKTPVITSNVSCLPEAGGPDSAYINPKNSQDIKETLLSLWNNVEKRKDMAEKGHIFVQKFNDENIAHQMNNLYLKVLKETK